MNLQQRIFLLNRLGEYILSNDQGWMEIKKKAELENRWFIPEFIDQASNSIAKSFLQKGILEQWTSHYDLKSFPSMDAGIEPKNIGLVMAGNIPLVGFHDWLCVFISGHKAMIKPSSKDRILITHLINKLEEWSEPGQAEEIKAGNEFADRLKGCDAYIATGSNNSSRYFEYYFGKYPNLIRKNKTSVAIIAGDETIDELEKLGDDVYLYFGLGCRNVTKIFVPPTYDFLPMLTAFKKYNYLAEQHHYKNNYDYNLALHLLNKKYYMTNGSILSIEDPSLFSPISQLNYEYYSDKKQLTDALQLREDLQCIIGKDHIPFGQSQRPAISDYADGKDTLEFLSHL
ncbi:MAG: acyl-CoA reductase [Bacteroidota bacterium]